MNKYIRAKKFSQSYQRNKRAKTEALNKKELKLYGTVLLSLLVCIFLYALCIHFNVFGIKDWCQQNEPVPISENTESNGSLVATEEPAAYIEHMVSINETLWSISSKYHPNEDTRKVIWAVRAFNPGTDGERMSAKILPGQVIRVPMDIEAVEDTIKEIKEARSDETEIELASRHDDRTNNDLQRDDGK
jgi:LysM repeat protein